MVVRETEAALQQLHRRFTLSLTPEELGKLDLSNKTSLRTLVTAVSATAIALITTVVSLRLFVRRRFLGRFFLDDYLVILASIFTIVVCACVLEATKYGLGQHIWNLHGDLNGIIYQLKRCIQMMYVANIFYALAIVFTKISIVASYIHIFTPQGVIRVIMYGTAVVTIGLGIASVPATIFECRPVYASWEFDTPGAKCYTFVNFLYASTAINVTTDIILCLVPLPCFWRLQLPMRQKVLISFLFFLGGLAIASACVAAIIRLAYLHVLQAPLDVTSDLVSSVMWTIAECTIGIICVSLPPLRAIIARLLPSFFRKTRTDPDSYRNSSRRNQSSSQQQQQKLQRSIDVVVMSSLRSAKAPSEYKFDSMQHQLSLNKDAGVSVVITAGSSSASHDEGRGRGSTIGGSTLDDTSDRLTSDAKRVDEISLVDKKRASLSSFPDSEARIESGWDGRHSP